MAENNIQERLFEYRDEKYRRFSASLMPTVDPDTVIGVRIPILRKYAKKLAREGNAVPFLETLPHTYFEENNLHAFLIEQIKDFDAAVAALDAFLPYVNNWATCDSMSPKILGKHLDALLPKIREWLRSEHVYTVRYAIGLLMKYYLDENFSPEYPAQVAEIRTEEYYVNMMIAWYFATALAKQYETVLPYITEERLPVWIHNKVIQKAIESYRITPQQKNLLRAYRIKINKIKS